MTGYGWAERQDPEFSLSVEIKGYNNRFLEVQIGLPSSLSVLERSLRELVTGRCKRGTVELSIRYREHNAPFPVRVNLEAARAYYGAALETARALGLGEGPSLETILAMEGVLEAEQGRDTEKALSRIEPLLKEALGLFEAERIREGAHTLGDILSHLSVLESSLARVASCAALMDEKLKETVKARFEELLGNNVDENRVLAETAALLIKYTISEELSRLDAHLKEFRAELDRNESPGKKLDFLCQELNREINTMGAKVSVAELGMEVVNMKEALENIREQLRNVE